MKRKVAILYLASFVILTLTILANAQTGAGRADKLINDGWRFRFEDKPESATAAFAGQPVTLPHTWNLKDPFDDEPGYIRGAGWYQRDVKLDAKAKGKRIFIYFEGANQVADVYVNGSKAGTHIGGYSAFSFDITDLVKIGSPNLIAVRVDNSFNADIPPLTADFTFYGGIYRNVRLIVTDPVHIKVTDMGSSGLHIMTPEINGARNTVNIKGKIENATDTLRELDVVSTVYDARGKQVGTSASKVRARPKSDYSFVQLTGPIAGVNLWSPESPYLYKVTTVIKEKGRILDRVTNNFGFRWFTYDAEKGAFLNGKPIKLKGTNRHQDYKGLGNAVPDALHVRDMELIKEAGFNFVRLAHYPQAPAVLDAADRLGLMIWEETPLVNYITISDAFNQNSAQMVREMIRQHRNHPSVIMWGYMNEIYLRVPKENEEKIRKETVKLAKTLNDIAHEEDPNRPTTIAFHGSEMYNTMGLGEIPDIIGWNLYNGWYSKKFEDFGPFVDEQHKKYPKRPLIISEYGANGDLRLHSENPRRFDSTTEYMRMFHESYLEQIKARPYLLGSAIWSQFDFGVELRGETIPHLNQKGMLTYDRIPKDVYYLYQANFSDKAVVHVAMDDRPYIAGSGTESIKVDVYSNQTEVELLLNGRSLGKKSTDDIKKASWDVTFHEGKNQLTANAGTVSDSAAVDYKMISVKSPDIAINVGSNTQFIDDSKTVWLADQAYGQGGWGYTGDDVKTIYSESPDRNVLGTLDDPLFQTMQENLTGYRLDVPAGEYEVELCFVETKFDKAGERIFDVVINGRNVLQGLDLTKRAGFQTAFASRFKVKAVDGIRVEFQTIRGKPVLSAIRVKKL